MCYSNFVKTWWNTLHLHFIPSVHNDHKPQFLRLKITATLLGIVIVTEGMYLAHTYLILPHSDFFAAIFASALVDETNQNRVSGDLGDLTPNTLLVKAAQLKADDMAAKGYFAHNTPDGKTPWYWFDQAGYDYAAAGENLAVNFTDSSDVTHAWMASPSHRANIMNGNYTEIGIATARGLYKGKDAIFVVEEFGRPALIARNVASVASSSANITFAIPANKDAAAVNPTPASSTASKVSKPVKALPTKVPGTSDTAAAASSPGTSSAPRIIATIPVATTTQAETSNVAGAETRKLNADVIISGPILERTHTTLLGSIVSSPRHAASSVYYVLAAILALALGFAVFVKIRIQHPHIIANGVLLIAIILSLAMLNAALGLSKGVI